jgi:hypothetical protein
MDMLGMVYAMLTILTLYFFLLEVSTNYELAYGGQRVKMNNSISLKINDLKTDICKI